MQNPTQKSIKKETSKGRRFGYLSVLDKYMFREFMIPFSVLCFTFILLFLIGDLFNDLPDFLGYKGSDGFSKAVRYFTLKMPGNIRFVFPISVLLSCMYTIANMGRTREITAMRASGISTIRCGGAIFVVAGIVTAVNFWFNEKVVPQCSMEAEIIHESLENPDYDRTMYNMLQYRSADKRRDWLLHNLNEKGEWERVILKYYSMDDTTGTRIRKMDWELIAEKAKYDPARGWVFYNVRQTKYIPFAGPAREYKELVYGHDVIHETESQIQNAVKPPEDLSSADLIGILRNNKHMAKSLKNMYETLLYYRLSFPFVCLLCVCLGLPLAVKNERSGIFLSIIAAVAAIVVFQTLTEIFLIMGQQGMVPPLVGGVGPMFAFLLYSYFGVIRKSS
ncbi:MAG: LptF/LptG family permease [Lentisphaeria bacterium]|nr:LptF/LptG family permease [Lentisphaeria bacterium]